MIKRLFQSCFSSTLRNQLIAIASIIAMSLLIGLCSTAFIRVMNLTEAFRSLHPWIIFGLPLLSLFTVWTYHRFGKNSIQGNNLIIDSFHQNEAVPKRMISLALIFTTLSNLFGASVGREGTAIQMGGAIAHQFTPWATPQITKKKMIAAGVSAGFSSIFGTPLAGAFFGAELFCVGEFNYTSLGYCLLSAYIANAVPLLLGIKHKEQAIAQSPSISLKLILMLIVAAVIFGLIAKAFIQGIMALKHFYAKAIENRYLRAVIGGSVVLFIILLLNGLRFTGLSTWMIDEAFTSHLSLLVPLKKFVLTVLSLSAGFQGGEATPLFTIGASMGNFIAQTAHLDPQLFAALGYVGIYCIAANVPLTGIILGAELFGVIYVPYFAVTMIIGSMFMGHHSIFSAQRFSHKSRQFSLFHPLSR